VSTIASHAREQPTELPPDAIDAIEDEEDEEDDEDDEEGIIAFAGLTNGLRHRRQLTKIDRYTKGVNRLLSESFWRLLKPRLKSTHSNLVPLCNLWTTKALIHTTVTMPKAPMKARAKTHKHTPGKFSPKMVHKIHQLIMKADKSPSMTYRRGRKGRGMYGCGGGGGSEDEERYADETAKARQMLKAGHSLAEVRKAFPNLQ